MTDDSEDKIIKALFNCGAVSIEDIDVDINSAEVSDAGFFVDISDGDRGRMIHVSLPLKYIAEIMDKAYNKQDIDNPF